MNFGKVLRALQEMQADRAAAVADAESDVRAAERRLELATLDKDMRVWSQEDRDEYYGAIAAVDEAYEQLKKAKEAL